MAFDYIKFTCSYPISLFKHGIFFKGRIIASVIIRVSTVVSGTPIMELIVFPLMAKPK